MDGIELSTEQEEENFQEFIQFGKSGNLQIKSFKSFDLTKWNTTEIKT